MHIPEWEIEEAIIWNPKLIEIPGKIENLRFIESQRYLQELGGFIDILFKMNGRFVIVEVKCNVIDDLLIITDQILKYRENLAKEENVNEEDIISIVTSPKGFSEDVSKLCKRVNVIPMQIDAKELEKTIPKLTSGFRIQSLLGLKEEDIDLFRVLRRRSGLSLHKLDPRHSDESKIEKVRSTETWIKSKVHDEVAMEEIANCFTQISKVAPIRAHEVRTSSNGQLKDTDDMWFWLFYSVMDRRANASTFVIAKEALEEANLFLPERIARLVKEKGEPFAREQITRSLKNAEFPLIYEGKWGDQAFSKSIIDAALLMKKYDYNFEKFYRQHIKTNKNDMKKACESLWNEINKKIYGAGPRIASQFIRGMVLKGPWEYPLIDDRFLEKNKFNIEFAGPTRLRLIKNEKSFTEHLGRFADKYLGGNRAIISHVLWYIRKRFCYRSPLCNECKIAGYCCYFLEKFPTKYFIERELYLKKRSHSTSKRGKQDTLDRYTKCD